jgi:hypothetical protein
MDIVTDTKTISLFSKLSTASFLTIALVACGGGDGDGNELSDGPGQGTLGDDSSNEDNSIVSDNYVETALRVYATQVSAGGIHALDAGSADYFLEMGENGQEVTACDISGEKSTNVEKSGLDDTLNPGDNMTTTYLQCDNGKGNLEGTASINIIEYNEVSNTESSVLYDYFKNITLNGEPRIKNMRIKRESLNEESVFGINSDRYEADGSFKGNPNMIEHPAPHHEDNSGRFSRMIFERYENDSTDEISLYWDLEFQDYENSTFSFTTTVLEDVRINELGMYAGHYFVITQGDRIEVIAAGADNIQVTLDRNNDGTIDEQQQMTFNDFFASGFDIPE